MENEATIRNDRSRKISIDGATCVAMAELIGKGATLEEVARAFPFYSGNQIADLVGGWED